MDTGNTRMKMNDGTVICTVKITRQDNHLNRKNRQDTYFLYVDEMMIMGLNSVTIFSFGYNSIV